MGGDTNNANTDFNKKGVFHLKNITIEEEIKFDNKYLTDHPILIGKSIFRTNKLKNKESIKILNMSNVNANNQKIADFKNNKNPLLFSEPHKTIYIDKIEDKIDIEKFGEEYQKLKDENKIKNKEEWKLRYQNVNSILTQGILSKENWIKINKIILQNKKSKIWRETSNINRITEDFKKLYRHSDNNRNWDHNEIAKTIQTIFYIIQANSNIYDEEQKLYSPNSKAMDYNGFSQKIIINSILDQNINKEISNYMELFKTIEKGFDLFLHNKIRTILFKKKEDVYKQKNLRIISIIPAWLMVLEKLTKPIIQKLINEKLNKNQFGFRPKSDCRLAKAMIFVNSKKYKYNKSLLIDIKKAYDSMNLEKLIQIVNELFKNKADNIIINSFIKIYQKLTLIINNRETNLNRGLCKDHFISYII